MDDSNRAVELVVPTTPEFGGVVRIAAVGLASLAGLDIDKTEDLRLAADEMWIYLRSLDPAIESVAFRFTFAPGVVHTQARAPWKKPEVPTPTPDNLGWVVLTAITTGAACTVSAGHVVVSADVANNDAVHPSR